MSDLDFHSCWEMAGILNIRPLLGSMSTSILLRFDDPDLSVSALTFHASCLALRIASCESDVEHNYGDKYGMP